MSAPSTTPSTSCGWTANCPWNQATCRISLDWIASGPGRIPELKWFRRSARGSEHFQFVRDLTHQCVLLVVGQDKLFGSENLQDGIVFALLQGEKGAGKSFSLGLGHILASHVHVI